MKKLYFRVLLKLGLQLARLAVNNLRTISSMEEKLDIQRECRNIWFYSMRGDE